MGDMEHFQFLFIQVKQITVFIIQFNADGKVFIDIVQDTFTVLQCLIGGSHAWTILSFCYSVYFGVSFPISFLKAYFTANPYFPVGSIEQVHLFNALLQFIERVAGSMVLILP